MPSCWVRGFPSSHWQRGEKPPCKASYPPTTTCMPLAHKSTAFSSGQGCLSEPSAGLIPASHTRQPKSVPSRTRAGEILEVAALLFIMPAVGTDILGCLLLNVVNKTPCDREPWKLNMKEHTAQLLWGKEAIGLTCPKNREQHGDAEGHRDLSASVLESHAPNLCCRLIYAFGSLWSIPDSGSRRVLGLKPGTADTSRWQLE